MHIFYDDNMPYAKEVFSTLGTVQEFNHADISCLDVSQVDALMIRSTTKVDKTLVERLVSCSHIATATAGYNHLDLAALSDAGKQVYHAAGCNAQAVSEYALSAVLYALIETDKSVLKIRLGYLKNYPLVLSESVKSVAVSHKNLVHWVVKFIYMTHLVRKLKKIQC